MGAVSAGTFASAGISCALMDEMRGRFPGRLSKFDVEDRMAVALATESRSVAVKCPLPAQLVIRDTLARG